MVYTFIFKFKSLKYIISYTKIFTEIKTYIYSYSGIMI